MKRVRAFLLAALLSSPLCAEDVLTGVIGPFGGLNNSDSSLIIPSNMAQDLLNVDITPGGKSVKKREGFSTYATLAITTSAIHGVYSFYDSSGNDVSLFFNDTRLTTSIAGGAFTVIMSSATAAQTWQCVDSQGFAYCAGSSRQWVVKTQGTTWSQHTVVSTGTMLAVTPKRMVQAGFSATPSRLDFSKENDFTTWTVGSQPTDPITFTITAPGSRITHIVYAHKKIYWFKESSFGYILEGAELADWQIKIVSSEIGTLDNTSTQDTDGNLYFRGQDGHIYVTDGGSVEKLSKDITPTVESAGTRTSNSVTMTSASDWGAGTFAINTVYVDTITTSGNILTTFPEPFSSDRNGGGSTKNVWTDSTVSSGTVSVSGGQLRLAVSAALGSTDNMVAARTTEKIAALSWGTSIQFKVDEVTTDGAGGSDFALIIATHAVTRSFSDEKTFYFGFQSTASGTATLWDSGVQNGCDTPTDITVSTTVSVPFYFNVWVATSVFSYGVNGTQLRYGSWTDCNSSAAKSQYAFLTYNNITSTGLATVDYFHVAPQTFTWTSASQSISSSITSWDQFSVTKNESAGSLAFAIRSASTDSYTSVSDGAVPTIAKTTYWQTHSTFSLTDVTSTTGLSVSDITQNWFEGSAADKAYATFHEDRIWFSVAAGDGQSTNNRILIYDLITPGWTIYDLAANGFMHRNHGLYFGGSLASPGGRIFKFGGVHSDNLAYINAYWKSKDFFMDNPFVDKDFVSLSIAADAVESSSMTVTYSVNGQTGTSFTAPLGTSNTFARKNVNLPLGKVGGTLNVQFGNYASDQLFEVFAIQYGYRPRSWRPE